MSENPSDKDRDEAIKYDNWPVEGRSDRDVRWIGMAGVGAGQGAPALYEPRNDIIYEGNIDKENKRLVPDPETERQVSPNETIGDVLQDIADSRGWQSLSNFAAEHMGADIDEDDHESHTDHEQVFADSRFQQRNVAASADHQLGFFGSVTYEGEDGVYTLEHEFHVYTEPDQRENGMPTAEIEERRLHTETVDEARQGGDAELVDKDHHEIVLDIDPELTGRMEKEAIDVYCQEWHENAIQS